MGAKVQTKNYLPVYYSMHDFMENPTSSWSSYCQDKRLGEHIFNTYIPRPVNGCSEQDKEMLKRTMLEHEAIFRKQIYELHRLYRIQKDLMHECQTRNFDRSPVPAEVSYSSSFSSQRQPEYTETISQMSHFPVGVTSWGNMPCVVNDKTHPSFKRDSHVHSDQIPFPGGASRKDTAVLDCKPQKRTFDLQLPADVYMDIEGRDGSQKKNTESTNDATIPKNETLDLHPDNGKKLTLQSDEEVNHQVSNLTKWSCRSACVMVDLNKPSIEISCETSTNSASNQLFGMKPHNKFKHGYLSSLSSNTNFLDRLGDQQTRLLKDVYSEGEWPFFSHESGKKGSTVDDFSQANNNNEPNLSERLQLNSDTCCEGSPCDHHNPETWSRQELTPAIQSSPIFPSVPTISTSQADITSCTSSLASSWRKYATSKNMSVAAHAPPSFRGSSYLNNESLSSNGNAQISITYCRKWQTSRSLTTSLGTVKTVPYTNVMDPNSVPHSYVTSCKLDQINNHKENCHGHLPGSPEEHFHSRDLKTSIDLNLNRALPSGMEDVSTLKQDPACYDVCNKLAGGASWHKVASTSETIEEKKTSMVNFSLSNGHSKPIPRSNVITPNLERKGVKELDLSTRNLQEVTSGLQFTYHKIQRDTDSEKNGKIIIGFPMDGVNKQSSILVSTVCMEKLLADKTKFTENDNRKFTDFSCETKILNLQKIQKGDSATEIGVDMNIAKFRPHINLDAEFACADDSIPSEPMSEGELVVQPSHSISIFGAKIVSGVDLQTSASRAETNIMNQDKHISSNMKADSEKKNFCDELVRFAAENLVAISVDSNGCHNDIGSNLLCLPQFDTLLWFAEVVSHNSENLMLVDNGKNQCAESMDDDNNCHGDHDYNAGGGLDLFEAMTLELQEVKADQQCCREKNTDDKENGEEVKGSASMLFTKPRRGQGRKRRQRRDFQKDVLPGLASLSRLQTSEDLQTIWGMMKASGRPWEVSSTKRNTGQNTQRKGRRQLRSMAITVEEVHVTPHQLSPLKNAEIVVDGSSMIGWGRTTRRCRRQRCLPGNLVGLSN